MEFKELVSPSLTDLFVRELTSMILTGRLKINEKLPTERQLAEKMKVSLAVVNGGITRLTASGFLRVVPRKGVFVADYYRTGNIFTLKEILDYSGDNFDPDILEPIYACRRSIEIPATEKACLNRTDETLTIIEELIEKLRNTDSKSEFQELAFEIHHEVVIASGNIYYPMILQTFKPFYVVFYGMSLDSTKAELLVARFERFLEAMRNRDAAKAIEVLDESMSSWLRTMQKRLS